MHQQQRYHLHSVVHIQIQRLAGRLQHARNVALEFTANAIDAALSRAYDPVYGARPLRRFLEQQVTTEISKMLIGGSLKEGDTVVVDANEDQDLVFKVGAQAMDVDDQPARHHHKHHHKQRPKRKSLPDEEEDEWMKM